MKCKGKFKERTKGGNLVTRTCNEKIEEHQIFCHKCGEPTDALSGPLSAKENLKQVWSEFKPVKAKFYPFSIFIILTAFLLIGLAVYFTRGNYFQTNLALLFIVPFALIPLSFDENFISNHFTINMFFSKLKYYPIFFLFTLINIVYFALMKIICTGYSLNIAVDPVLHIVRLIMVLYWIAIIVPAPVLMIRKKMNPVKAIIVSYKAGKETRWQQFYIAVFVFVLNIVGVALIGLGLLVTIPLSYILIERYYLRMDEFELFKN